MKTDKEDHLPRQRHNFLCQDFVWSGDHGGEKKKMCEIVQFSSVTQSCPTLSDLMDCSMPGLPVHHQLLEFTQTHVHSVGNAIQPSHPLLSPSGFTLSQHQGLFK